MLGRSTLVRELEGEVLALPDEAVQAARQPDAVLLEAVAQPGLRHPHALLDLEREPVEVVEEVGVELLDVAGHDPARAGARRTRVPA